MQKFLVAFVACMAIACASAGYLPRRYGAPLAYVEIPVATKTAIPTYGGGYGGGYGGYGRKAVISPAVLYKPVPLTKVVGGGPRGALLAAPSNPTATAAAASSNVGLKPGTYNQWIVPSYSIVSGVPGRIGVGRGAYGGPAY